MIFENYNNYKLSLSDSDNHNDRVKKSKKLLEKIEDFKLDINELDTTESAFFEKSVKFTGENLISKSIKDNDFYLLDLLLERQIDLNNSYFYSDSEDDTPFILYANQILVDLLASQRLNFRQKTSYAIKFLDKGMKTSNPIFNPYYNKILIDSEDKGMFELLLILNNKNRNNALIKKMFETNDTESTRYSINIFCLSYLKKNIPLFSSAKISNHNKLLFKCMIEKGINPNAIKQRGEIPLYFYANKDIKRIMSDSSSFCKKDLICSLITIREKLLKNKFEKYVDSLNIKVEEIDDIKIHIENKLGKLTFSDNQRYNMKSLTDILIKKEKTILDISLNNKISPQKVKIRL